MTKELFVSSTPHETRVGLVEDDQLAEIYLERENEYTLAGSIYKGRVTRVLPGMQSAFVDIGLERDAFLYVSDFMELGEEQEEVDDFPTPQAAQEQASAAAASAETASSPETQSHVPAPVQENTPNARENQGENRGTDVGMIAFPIRSMRVQVQNRTNHPASNTAPLPDISRSFCRENRSRSISVSRRRTAVSQTRSPSTTVRL
jgi:Rne/Rng family ribonuclease